MTDPAGRPTIVADASFCDRTRAAGWAGAVIRGATFEATSGVLTAGLASTNSAEGAAMLNALRWALDRGLVVPGEAVLLATDSEHLWRKYEHLSRRNRARLERGEPLSTGQAHKPLRMLAAARGITFDVCWIRGHPNSRERRQSLRARVMRLVDQAARTQMLVDRRSRLEVYGPKKVPPPWRDTAADLRAAGALFLGVDA